MERYEKVYVSVWLKVDGEGSVSPVALEWEDGTRYKIDRVKSVRKAPADKVGAVLTKKYEVLVEGRERIIYEETHTKRWFVERIVP